MFWTVCSVNVTYDALPMNEPVLQMRLKKQLSGGRVPHLLQKKRRKKNMWGILWKSALHSNYATNYPPQRSTRLERLFSLWKYRWGAAIPHILLSSCLTFHLLHAAFLLRMGNVCRRGSLETVNTRCLCPSSCWSQSLLSWLSYTHSSLHGSKSSIH